MAYCVYPVSDSNGSHEPTAFDPYGSGHSECGRVATVKMYGFWYCEAHADEVENKSEVSDGSK